MAKSDTLQRYFHETVLRAYTDYKKAHDERAAGRSNDLYLAKKAAEVLYHFREQLHGKRTYPEFRDKCHDYRLIRDIANSSKHGEDKRPLDPKRDAPLIEGPKSIYECMISTTYQDDLGEYRDTQKGVFVKLLDGTERDVFEITTNVINMWCKEMMDLGEIQKLIHFEIDKVKEPRLREECSMEFALNFERGAPAQQIIKMQRFNYNKNAIEPINLSGHNFELKVYEKGKFIAEGRFQGPEDYIPFKIAVTEEEVIELQAIRTKEEFQVRFFEKAIAQGVTEAFIHNNDGTHKIGKDGKPVKIRIGLKKG